MTWPRLWWRWDRDLFLCGISAPGRLQRVRILYVVRGEARPRSWIIMIYGLAERGGKKKCERESKWDRGEEKGFLDDIIIAECEKKRIKVEKLHKVSPVRQKMCLIFRCTGANNHSPHSEHTSMHTSQTSCSAVRHCCSRTSYSCSSQLSSDAMLFFLHLSTPHLSFCALICWQQEERKGEKYRMGSKREVREEETFKQRKEGGNAEEKTGE